MEKQSSIVKGKTIKQVRKINLSRLGLKEIPAEVFQHTNLTKLVLSRNAITQIPKEIAKLKNLEVLDLTYNDLTSLPAPLFKLPKLRVLAIGHNKIKKFPAQIVGSSIKELIADHNQIEKLEPEALNSLERLILGHNPIGGQIVTHSLRNLRYFDFQHTNLSNPPEELLPAECKGRLAIRKAVVTPVMAAQAALINGFLHRSDSKRDEEKKSSMELGSVFISHSSKDKEIVEEFSDKVLRLGLGLSNDKIRCTSIEGASIPNGEKMRDWIHENIKNCSLAILMISPAYQKSQICLNEMGAIWALEKPVKILLLPGIEYKTMGWLEEIRQAGHIDNETTLDALVEEIRRFFGLNFNVAEWGRNRKSFLKFCSTYKHSYDDEQLSSKRSQVTDEIYLSYCSRIFNYLWYKKYSGWSEMLISSTPRVSVDLLDDFETLREYLDSRFSHEGYEAFDRIFEAMSLWAEDFLDVFNIYAESRDKICRIRPFYKEDSHNPTREDDRENYNAYIDLIRNMVFELTCLGNQLLKEARCVKVDFMPEFGIFSIDGISHKGNGIVKFYYRRGEIYNGLKEFLNVATTRKFYRPLEIERVSRVIKEILEVK